MGTPTDFTQDRVGRHGANAGNVRQVDAEDPIQFLPQIECGLIMLALIRPLLGTFRHLGLGVDCCRKTFEVILDYLIDIVDRVLVTAKPFGCGTSATSQ
jgi:hypothetical protein